MTRYIVTIYDLGDAYVYSCATLSEAYGRVAAYELSATRAHWRIQDLNEGIVVAQSKNWTP